MCELSSDVRSRGISTLNIQIIKVVHNFICSVSSDAIFLFPSNIIEPTPSRQQKKINSNRKKSFRNRSCKNQSILVLKRVFEPITIFNLARAEEKNNHQQHGEQEKCTNEMIKNILNRLNSSQRANIDCIDT